MFQQLAAIYTSTHWQERSSLYLNFDLCYFYLAISDLLMQYSKKVERLGFDENYVDVTEMLNSPPWCEKIKEPVPDHIYKTNSEEPISK